MKTLAVYVATVILALAAGFAVQTWRGESDADPVAGANAAAAATVSDPAQTPLTWLDGEQRSLSAWRGQLLVVNFWATWCPPCIKEIPAFVTLQERYRDEGLQFVGIAVNDPDEARQFIEEHGVNFPILADPDIAIELGRELGNEIGGLPYTVVFDRSGEVILRHHGEWVAADAEAFLSGEL